MTFRAAPATILQIIPRLDTGGAELSTVEVTSAITAAGGRALIATAGGRLAPEIERQGGRIIPLPADTKNPLVMARNVARLVEIGRREQVSIIHARSRAPAWSALAAARRLAVPFVTTYHGAYNETSALKRLYNGVMARGDEVIANSGFTRDLILARYGGRDPGLAGRIRVIHRGIDVSAFDAAAIEPQRIEALRRAWGLEPRHRVVLQPARLTAWKGQADLIAAIARLEVGPDLRVVLAGDAQGRDGYVAALEARIAASGLGSVVSLVGHCADMPAAYALARVTVIASVEPEAFGRTATEAQAAGCPVIATAIGAPPETVLAQPSVPRERITGWLVPPAEPGALAAALETALGLSDDDRRRMGGRAREHVARHFSLAGMQAQTLEVYDRLLGASPGTALADRFRERHCAKISE